MVRYDCHRTGEDTKGFYFRDGERIGNWDLVSSWYEGFTWAGKNEVYEYTFRMKKSLEELYKEHLLFSSELFVWEDE